MGINSYTSTGARKVASEVKFRENDSWHDALQVYKREGNVWRPAWQYKWVEGAWGACSRHCGGGTQSRPITCKRFETAANANTNSGGIVKPDSYCQRTIGNYLGAREQSCNTHSCIITCHVIGSVDDRMNFYYTTSLANAKRGAFWQVWGNTGFGNTKHDYSGDIAFNFTPNYAVDGYGNVSYGWVYFVINVWDTNRTHQGCNISVGRSRWEAVHIYI